MEEFIRFYCPKCERHYELKNEEGVLQATVQCIDCKTVFTAGEYLLPPKEEEQEEETDVYDNDEYQTIPARKFYQQEQQTSSFDPDATIPPQRESRESDYEQDATIPGKRDRKTNGRFMVGDLILNRYKVLAELGQGGMGVVYKCFDETAGIEIALKALPPELSHNAVEMEDIKENFQLIHNLHHPNIASSNTLEKDSRTGDYYLIMECVEGEDLRRYLKRKRKNGTLTQYEVIAIVKQVAEALDYAHSQKIIHRDIKPGNIMIDADGHVKVLDFGLAAQIHSSLSHVSMAYHGTSGTGPYMAPEQWLGRQQNAAADQYALAVMTYELLAGFLPFDNPDSAILREAVLHDSPAELKGFPANIKIAVAKGMSNDPALRFPNCRKFVQMLESEEHFSSKRSFGLKWLLRLAVLVLLGAVGYCYYPQLCTLFVSGVKIAHDTQEKLPQKANQERAIQQPRLPQTESSKTQADEPLNTEPRLEDGLVFYAPLKSTSQGVVKGNIIQTVGRLQFTVNQGIPCAFFDGKSHFSISTSALPGSQEPCTISLWVKCTKLARFETNIFSCGRDIFLRRRNGQLTVRRNLRYEHSPEKAFTYSQWNHVLYEVTQNQEKIFVNGTLCSTRLFDEPSDLPARGYIGTCRVYPQINIFTGYLSSIRVYNRTLSTKEISVLSKEFTVRNSENPHTHPTTSQAEQEKQQFDTPLVLEMGLDTGIVFRLKDGCFVVDGDEYGGVGVHFDLKQPRFKGLHFGYPACLANGKVWRLWEPLKLKGTPTKIEKVELLYAGRKRVMIGPKGSKPILHIWWTDDILNMGDGGLGDPGMGAERYKIRITFNQTVAAPLQSYKPPVFYAALGEKKYTSESGASMQLGSADFAFDKTLGRIVAHFEKSHSDNSLTSFSPNIPVGNAPFSLSCWAKIGNHDTNNYTAVLGIGNPPWSNTFNALAIHPKTSKILLTNWHGAEDSRKRICSQKAITDGTWHYLAGVFDGQHSKLYVDGNLEASSLLIKYNAGEGKIDKTKIGIGTFWCLDKLTMSVAEAKIYDYAISDEQIAAENRKFQEQLQKGNHTDNAVSYDSSFTVTTAKDVIDADDGVISLREAVYMAQQKGGKSLITFNIPDTDYVSFNSPIQIHSGVTVKGINKGTGHKICFQESINVMGGTLTDFQHLYKNNNRGGGDLWIYSGQIKNGIVTGMADFMASSCNMEEMILNPQAQMLLHNAKVHNLTINYRGVVIYSQGNLFSGFLEIGGAIAAKIGNYSCGAWSVPAFRYTQSMVNAQTDFIWNLSRWRPRYPMIHLANEAEKQNYGILGKNCLHSALVDNMEAFSGAGSYTIKIRQGQALGSYQLAANAHGFNSSVSLKIGDTAYRDLLTPGKSCEIQGKKYHLFLNERNMLILEISDSSSSDAEKISSSADSNAQKLVFSSGSTWQLGGLYRGTPFWIWENGKISSHAKAKLFRTFTLDEIPQKAEIFVTADDEVYITLNGQKIGFSDCWDTPRLFNLKPFLRRGVNQIIAEGKDHGQMPCGLLMEMRFMDSHGKIARIYSDTSWKDSKGNSAVTIAPYGEGQWGRSLRMPFRLSPLLQHSQQRPSATSYIVNLPNGVQLEMVKIKAGTFMMGNPHSRTRYDWQHKVTLTEDFWISKYEITEEQHAAVTGRRSSANRQTRNNYAAEVTWDGAMDFCHTLNLLTTDKRPAKYVYSIPTEAQWEYACRAGTTTDINNGKNLSNANMEEVAVFGNRELYEKSEMKSRPIALKKPNNWGLYDMHGGHQEWCLDYTANYRRFSQVNPIGIVNGAHHIFRGGAYNSPAEECASWARRVENKNSGWVKGIRLALIPEHYCLQK